MKQFHSFTAHLKKNGLPWSAEALNNAEYRQLLYGLEQIGTDCYAQQDNVYEGLNRRSMAWAFGSYR